MNETVVGQDSAVGSRSPRFLSAGTLTGFLIAIFAVATITFLSYRSLETRSDTANHISQTLDKMERLQEFLSRVKDAETGQRGFLLTGEESYIEPYTNAKAVLPGETRAMRMLAGENIEQQQQLDALSRLADAKMEELGKAIALRRGGNPAAALALVRTNRGKDIMDNIRVLVAQLLEEDKRILGDYQDEWQRAAQYSSIIILGGSGLLMVLIFVGAVMSSRDYRAREKEVWLRSGQAALAAHIQGEHRLEILGATILEFLAKYLNAQVGAIYVSEGKESFRRIAGYALPMSFPNVTLPANDSLVGQAGRENRVLRVSDLSADHLPISSGLGRSTSRELLIAPASGDGTLQAVIELGFLHALLPIDQEFLARLSELVGLAMRSSRDRARLESLLEETQQQAEELQAQQEELRVNNEELEEQGRALKQSQTQLELQQTELQQSNAQLEEHSQLLEKQKDDLSVAQRVLSDKAVALERSNQFKSEFLANMSHELRTPLNSSLILAKLLSDNKEGNLNAEQVKFAQTIYAAGNDLLTLINDILDLSKIEAGQVSVEPVLVPIVATVNGLIQFFQPTAQEKGLVLTATVEAELAENITTDPHRLSQILKNLLSNALKFTEHGQVSLRVFAPGEAMVAFSIRDSGIGIPVEQQGIIFEAFRQADGSTHRKYGGTGLGLSISRDLGRLLGGEITVESAPGKGSTFTLTLPLVYSSDNDVRKISSKNIFATARTPSGQQNIKTVDRPARADFDVRASTVIDDDRERLAPDSRLILVIEDDPRFAAILRDLAHELNFQCVVVPSANDGLAAAVTYRPSAIVLDINLPDHSGLGVLDQLKRNPQTRHIPVHVASVTDYVQAALELGAIGFALKPVKREELIHAFRRLEEKFSQGMRKVLIVEDDKRQRESMRQLLENKEVEITSVASAAEALRQLQVMTFDCMVMDLNLPDLSGYELLEKMAAEENVSFPPVIVYTGRSLTHEEEQRLGRYSRSIIIKDARSPERLLDEVTLFLHQVEATLPPEHQRMLKVARGREARLEGRRVMVVEDDVRNIFALSHVLEPRGMKVEIARNGAEAIEKLTHSLAPGAEPIDLVLMDIMMPQMDGLTAMREIRKHGEWKKLPIIALTAKAMKDDQEKCLGAGANDYIAKPLDVEKLLSLVRVWMPK